MATETTQLMHANGTGQVIITSAPATNNSLTPATYSEAERLAAAMYKSQMFGVKSPEQAMVVLMTGLELGFSPAQAFRGIHVINNKPTLSADMMVAICKSRPDVCEYFRLVESNDDHAVYETQRVGEAEPTANEFTMADAKRAGLLTNPTWQKFPPQMLRARASSGLARAVYPDLILGLYTPDEAEAIEPRRDDSRREAAPRTIPVAPVRPQLAEPEPADDRNAPASPRSTAPAPQGGAVPLDRPKSKLDPGLLRTGAARYEQCEKCSEVVAFVTFGNGQVMAYNADGRAHPPLCGHGSTGWDEATGADPFPVDEYERNGPKEDDPFAGAPTLPMTVADHGPGHGD